jgi:hypothetical protein
MPGRLPLTRVAVPLFSWASRACLAAGTLIPARAAMTATAAPAGSADSAARTAAAGLSPAAGATGAGAGVVAVSAALRAACGAGAGVGVRAMMVTPFLFSGAIPVSVLTAPVFSGRQLLWSRREVKRLRDNSRCRFSRRPTDTEIRFLPVFNWHDDSRQRPGRRFSGRQPDRILTFRGGHLDFPRPSPFFSQAFMPVPRSGARGLSPARGARESRGQADRAGRRPGPPPGAAVRQCGRWRRPRGRPPRRRRGQRG